VVRIHPVRTEIPGSRSALPIAELYLGIALRGAVALLCDEGDQALDVSETMNSLAEHGYESVAAAVASGQGDRTQVPEGELVQDTIVLVDHLGKRGWTPAQIGIIGYGLGGYAAFAAAVHGSFGAAVSVSPHAAASPVARALTDMAGRAASVRTPWLGLIGGPDNGQLRSAIRQLETALAASSPVYTEVVAYRAAIAPLYSHAPDSAAHAAAFDAWQRTTEWLNLRVAPRLTPLAKAWRARPSEQVTLVNQPGVDSLRKESEMSEYVNDDREMPRFRVNREVMVNPAVFARERELIFDKSWLYLGHETELRKPNDFKTRTVAGRPLIFARDAKGAIRVWVNSCPHRGAMLCREQQGNARFLTCFYHGWTFNSSGDMVSMPGDDSYGPNFERPNLGAPAKVDSYRGFVFVSFDPGIVDLPTYLAGAKEYLDLICDQSSVGMTVLEGTHEYSVKANWKLLVENSFDGYHAVSTHQRYFEMVMAARGKLDASALSESRGIDLGNGHGVIAGQPATEGLFGRPTSDAARAEKEERITQFRQLYGDKWVDRMRGARNLVIFPNLVVIDLVMGVVVRKIDPISPDYMEVTAWELVPPEEGEELHRQRLDNFLTFWGPGGLASPDDVEALETCQRSYAARREVQWSDISRGMYSHRASANDELQMRTFWRRWNRLITGEELPPEEQEPLDELYTAQRLADRGQQPASLG